MQVENLTKEQFIRDFKDTLHHEQLIKVAKATPTEIFTALAGLTPEQVAASVIAYEPIWAIGTQPDLQR